MDKARFRSRLLDLVRECVPFAHTARVTLLMTVRMDDQPEAISVDVSEELTRPATAAAAAAAATVSAHAAVGGSKRKSQAPQRMVPTGEDSFAPATSAAAATAAAAEDASSSFNADLSSVDDQQPLNLSSRQGSPSVGPASAAASTPVKPPPPSMTAAFQLNNPDLVGMTYPRYPHPASFAIVSAAPSAAPPAEAAANQSQPLQSRPLAVRSRRPGSRTFPCNQCGQVFQSLAGLSKHTFTMHRVYKCTFCGANFTQRSNLQRHSLKHVGFKPFECRCCRKSYYRKDHLVRHIEVTHPGHDPKLSIDTRLSSAECLSYLEKKHESRDYTSLSGVVMSAAAAAAAAAEGGLPAGSEGALEDAEELKMMVLEDLDCNGVEEDEDMDGELDEEPVDVGAEAAGADEEEYDDQCEIDVGREDEQQPQSVAAE